MNATKNIDLNTMKRKSLLYSWIIILSGCFLLTGCYDENLPGESTIGSEVSVKLNFGAISHDKIDIQTRGTYDLHYESMVRNLYVFVFANGQKVYGRYFDSENLDKTNEREYWTVTNMTPTNSSVQTSGTLHMTVPSVSSGAEIVLIANLDLDFLNVSQENLALISKKADLEKLIASLNQEIPDRNAGFSMMTGQVSNATIASNGSITIPNNQKIMLKRLDAKVEVNVLVNPNNVSNGQKVEKFTPESWQVINMPKKSFLIPNSELLQLTKDDYFNSEPSNFEKTQFEVEGGNATGGVINSFSFYTLENMRSGDKKKSVNGNFHNRERRNKYLDDELAANYGQYDNTNGMWEYAPELATYVIIKGELEMVVDPGLTTEQHLVAKVTYNVHLGDFASDKDNYDVLRNTHYKYTINIKGVDNIKVEVETSNDNIKGITEDQPGAMGHLYETDEEIYTFDAHYGQRVYTIKASDVDIDNMTWYVSTPFGREGIPTKDINGNEIYNDLDYKWVEFMLNNKTDNTYSSANMPYPSDKSKLQNVIEFLNTIRQEVTAWRNGESSKFDRNGEMKFTVFVNEFYYDENPMNPNDHEILWKKFVNQPNRLMHILCKNQRSADKESSITGSILTIRQRSIQTPFNISKERTDLNEAWGCETSDETNNEGWFYHKDERLNVFNTGTHMPRYTADNTSQTDGLYNTACLLNLVSGTGNNKSVNTSLRWDTYIDYNNTTSTELKLKADYNVGLYSVLLRNRDLDGDGIIDPEELRWYIASLDQLCGLFIGDQGLSSEAQLYPIEASREPNSTIASGPFAGCYPWRLHVVSSTASDGAGSIPTIVWAEEGASTGAYRAHGSKPGYSPVKCVRNLGMELPTATSIKTAGENFPEDPLVIVTRPTGTITKNSVYKFDMRNMNKESMRQYYTSHELVPGDEYTSMARVYDGFITGALEQYTSSTNKTYNILKGELESGGSPAPQGYRVPNLREGVIMHLYCRNDATWWDGKTSMVSNFYSFGYWGNNYDSANNREYYSWTIRTDLVTVGPSDTQYIRYVKDWQPE